MTTAAGDPPAMPSGRLDRGILVVSSVVVIGSFMSILDTTIVNVALATLSRKLNSPLLPAAGGVPARTSSHRMVAASSGASAERTLEPGRRRRNALHHASSP